MNGPDCSSALASSSLAGISNAYALRPSLPIRDSYYKVGQIEIPCNVMFSTRIDTDAGPGQLTQNQ